MAKASPQQAGGAGQELTAQPETAQVTVDGILLTYIGAPLGSNDSSSWTITKEYQSTVTLQAEANRSITISADVDINSKIFSAGGSVSFTQSNSTQVTNGITLSRSTTQQISTPAPGAIGNTVFLGLRRPQINLTGDTSKLRFKFLKAIDTFAISLSDFQNNPTVKQLFSQHTIDSFLSQYVPLTDPTGKSLVKPRFKLRLSIALSPGVIDVFTFTKSRGSSFSQSKTSRTSVEIVEKRGFDIGPLSVTFQRGQTLEFAHTSVQEMDANKIISVSTTLNRSDFGVSKVFYDRVFKTFVIIDAGPPDTSTQPVVQGKIMDAGGAPIPKALVKLNLDNADYAALTDANGNYSIATARQDPLPAGTYNVVCGDVTKNVTISTGTARLNLSNVNRAIAQQRLLEVTE